MKKSYVIYGSGGHAKVICDLIFELGGQIECIFDDNANQKEEAFMNIPIHKYNSDMFMDSLLIIAIGNNQIRKKVASMVSHNFGTLVHPKATVSALSFIGIGTVILGNAVIQAEARIGNQVIINIGACVDHEAIVEDFANIGPLVYIGGGTQISKMATIEANATISRNLLIDENVLVKSGAVFE